MPRLRTWTGAQLWRFYHGAMLVLAGIMAGLLAGGRRRRTGLA